MSVATAIPPRPGGPAAPSVNAEILTTLQLLCGGGQTCEIRALGIDGAVWSGYGDDPLTLTDQIVAVDSTNVTGIYCTLNPTSPALKARRSRIIKVKNRASTTSDAEIIHRRWLPIDLDPTRPTGISSTETEKAAARDIALKIRNYLSDLGWPSPVEGDSGNGWHLLYAIDLPNDATSTDLLRDCLEALAHRFNTSDATVDRSNHNASRIWKLYGTMVRKGENTSDRPHRRSRLIAVPDPVVVVPVNLLEILAAEVRVEKKEKRDASPNTRKKGGDFDLADWLGEHEGNLPCKVIRKDKPGHRHFYSLNPCPFSGGAHKDGAFLGQLPGGPIFARCHHSSCGGKNRWHEFRAMGEPGYTPVPRSTWSSRSDTEKQDANQRVISKNIPETTKTTMTTKVRSPADVNGQCDTDQDQEINQVANGILAEGKPLEYFRNVFSQFHSGDQEILDLFVLAGCAQAALTTQGIQPALSGVKGAGKTTGALAALHLYPPEYVVSTSFSSKALFYDENLRPGCTIFSDDTTLPPDLEGLVKRACSAFQQGTSYLTVAKNESGRNAAKRLFLPPRVVFVFTSVYDSGDDETLDRQYRLSIAPTSDAWKKFNAFLAERMESGREELSVTPEVRVCQEMLRIIKGRTFRVRVPFAKRIQFVENASRRDMVAFYDFVQACAILHFQQRTVITEEDGSFTINADVKDFTLASEVFKISSDTMLFRLTKEERSLVVWIADKMVSEGVPESKIIEEYGKAHSASRSKIRRVLYGLNGDSGLLAKVPGMYMQKETIRRGEDKTISRNVIFCPTSAKSTLDAYEKFVGLPDQGDHALTTPDHKEVVNEDCAPSDKKSTEGGVENQPCRGTEEVTAGDISDKKTASQPGLCPCKTTVSKDPEASPTQDIPSPPRPPTPTPTLHSLAACGFASIPDPKTFKDIGTIEQSMCLVCQKPSHEKNKTPTKNRKGTLEYRPTRVNILLRSSDGCGPLCQACLDKLRFELIAKGVGK